MIHQPQGELQLLSCSSPKTHEWYFFQPVKHHAWQHRRADITFAYRSSVYGMICLESWSSYPSIDTSIVYVFTWLDIVCFQFLQHSHLMGQIGCHVTSHRPALLLWFGEIWKNDKLWYADPNTAKPGPRCRLCCCSWSRHSFAQAPSGRQCAARTWRKSCKQTKDLLDVINRC